jgi:hypothetical protein
VVAVGTVASNERTIYQHDDYLGDPSGYDMCPSPYALVELSIERCVFGCAADTLEYLVDRGCDLNTVCHPAPSVAVPDVGGRYLFLLDKAPPFLNYPGFAGIRLQIVGNGVVHPTSWWAEWPGLRDLLGVTHEELQAAYASADRDAALTALARVTLDEAIAKIEAAKPAETLAATMADAPTPEAIKPPDASDVPTPSPSPGG